MKINRIDLYNLYINKNYTLTQIAEYYNCSFSSLQRLCKKLDIEKPKNLSYKKLSTNDNFFQCYNNAYWAGFIAADGNICKSQPKVSINLSRKDVDLIIALQKQSNHNGTLYYSNTTSGSRKEKRHPMVGISICSKQWVEDLDKYWNIKPQKSLNLQPPNITDLNLCLAYIIGYIDGDGCVRINTKKQASRHTKNPKPYLELNICGSQTILEWIASVIFSVENQTLYLRPLQLVKNSNSDCWSILANRQRGLAILDILEKIVTPYRLNRKWSKITEFKKTCSSL